MSPFGRVIAAVSAVHLAVGVWVAAAVPGPLLSADDVAYLSLARTLAGEGSSSIGAQPPYGLLYPLLLAPGWLVGLGEPDMLTFARVVNAVLGAALIPVLFLLARRLLGAERGWALAAAVIGASLPASWLTGSIVWTERLLPLLVAVAVLGLTACWHERRGFGVAVAVGAAVALVAAHQRMVVAAVVVVVAASAFRGLAGDRRGAVIASSAGVVGMGLTELARRVIHDDAFGDSGSYWAGDLASRRGLGDVPDMAVHATGSLGNLVLASAGLAVVGAIILWRARPVGWVALGMLASVVATAGWFLTGVERADAWFHGRYVAVCAPLFVAAGVVGLRRLSWRTLAPVLVVAPVVAGFVGAWSGPGANWSRARSPVMMLGVEISGAPFGTDVFEPGAAASMALLVGLVLYGVVRVGLPALAVGVAVAAFALGVLSGIEGLRQLHETATAGVVEQALHGIEVEELAVDSEAVQPNVVAAVAWELGLAAITDRVGIETTHLLLPESAVDPPTATLVAELPGSRLWALR